MSEQDFNARDKSSVTSDSEPSMSRSEEHTGSDSKAARQAGNPECSQQMPLPGVSFSTFIFSLSTSALVNLGELPDPQTNRSCRDLTMAKQTIDVLAMIQEKTKGNLDQDEQNLLTNLLYELRLKYVSAVR